MNSNPLLRGLRHRRTDAPIYFWQALHSVARGRWGRGGRLFKPALAALLLTGCATTRYVTVPCLTKDQVLPSEPEKIHDKLTGEADKDLRIVAGNAVRLRAWGEGLHGVLEGCRAK